MSLRDIVIIGTGQAGFQVAASLRQEGYEGRLLMFGDEAGLPYQRPPLSKTFLKEGHPERLLFRNADFFAANGIEIQSNTPIASVSPSERSVTTERGNTYHFDHLVLATGTRNRQLPIPGFNAPNVFGMRTLEDASRIRDRLEMTSEIVVIGGGFIGLEFTAAAKQLGKKPTVVEAQDRLMARAVSEPVSEFFLAAHRRNGVDIRLRQTVLAVETDSSGNAFAVRLSTGERVFSDLILVAAGVVPNCELAYAAGLKIENGIAVDRTMLTSAPNISAVGDCVSFPLGDRRLRLESVQNAADQARCVARRLTGAVEPYDKLPWFWSDQGADKLQIAGLIEHADKLVAKRDDETGRLTVFGFSAERLCAVETVNRPGDHMAARKVLSASDGIMLADLEASHYRLKEVFRTVARP
ncbi:NAD(P)/FAD-dependent oxidoreductase [Chelativorans alearense]|uniref:NAD(P)/FAD-dependent oxidoreductase n=1 Tax=Chelativorans alearense TaxID=2681495 RepID=UPI0013D31509|nr:FAD-dependent oxidoreductase [Chelativorans alearense]